MEILTETGRCVNRSGHVDRNAHVDRLAVNSCLGLGKSLKVSKQLCLKTCPEPWHVLWIIQHKITQPSHFKLNNVMPLKAQWKKSYQGAIV